MLCINNGNRNKYNLKCLVTNALCARWGEVCTLVRCCNAPTVQFLRVVPNTVCFSARPLACAVCTCEYIVYNWVHFLSALALEAIVWRSNKRLEERRAVSRDTCSLVTNKTRLALVTNKTLVMWHAQVTKLVAHFMREREKNLSGTQVIKLVALVTNIKLGTVITDYQMTPGAPFPCLFFWNSSEVWTCPFFSSQHVEESARIRKMHHPGAIWQRNNSNKYHSALRAINEISSGRRAMNLVD